MAKETLPSTISYLTSNKTVTLANLIEIELPSPIGAQANIYLTDYSRDVEYDGQVYTSGLVKNIGDIKSTHKFSSHTTSITLSGVDDALILSAMDDYSYIGNRINVYRTHVKADGTLLPYYDDGTPRYLLNGTIVEVSATDTVNSVNKGSSVITFKCANEFYDLDKIGGRFTSDKAHRALAVNSDGNLVPSDSVKREEYKGDLGFYHSDQSINILAEYQTMETKYKMKKTSSMLGLSTSYSLKSYEMEVTKEVDLRYNLAGKFIPVIYGVQKTSGIPIFADTDLNDPNTVTVVYALCEGPIEGLLDIWLDDNPTVCFDDSDSVGRACLRSKRETGGTIIGTAGELTTHGSTIVLNDGNGDIKITIYHGLASQLADPSMVTKASNGNFYNQNLNSSGPEYWDDNFKLLDTAYLVVEFKLNDDRLEIPEISAEVQGRKIRTYTSTSVFTDTNTSINPAWQVYDYLTNDRFGMGVPTSRVDLQEFVVAAELFDAIDYSYQPAWCLYWAYLGWTDATSSSNRAIMQMNVLLKSEETLFKNMEGMLDQSVSSLNVVNGLYTITVEAAADPVMNITIDDIVGGMLKASDVTIKNKYNSVSTTIKDPAKGWKNSNVIFFNSEFKLEDKGVEKALNLTFPFITNYYTARSMAERELKKSRYNREVSVTLPYYAVDLPINKPVTITYPRYGWDAKQFLIRSTSAKQDGKVEVKLREYADDVFINSDYADISNEQIPTTSNLVRSPRDVGFAQPPADSLVLGINGVLSWLPSTYAAVELYTVRIVGRSDYYSVEPENATDRMEVNILNLPAGVYTFQVRAVAPEINKSSSPAELTVTLDPIMNLPAVTNFVLSNGDADGVWASNAPEFEWDVADDFVSFDLEIIDDNNDSIDAININGSNVYTWDFQRNINIYAATNSSALGYYRRINARIKGVNAEGNKSYRWSYVNDND
jgi:hypothetical protein